jgi:molybdenum cofactor cytidylyltransferase
VSIAGIVLAAGASARMGSPKALLRIGDETFVERLVRVMAAHCRPVIVVLGYQAEAIRSTMGGLPGAAIAFNPNPALGQLSSLQAGLRQIGPETEAALFCPVDCPAIAESTIRKVCEAWYATSSAALIRPRHKQRNGHPVLVNRELIGQLLALPPAASAKDLMRANAGKTLFLDLEDPAILGDIDTPDDYARLAAHEVLA